jgi:cytoskeletal protein CcmA (bactofilin family)
MAFWKEKRVAVSDVDAGVPHPEKFNQPIEAVVEKPSVAMVVKQIEEIKMNTPARTSFDRNGAADSNSTSPTVIRAGLHLEGNIRTVNDILLEGSVRGDVSANSITVATGASLSGTVSATVIIVDGTIEGVVNCMKLQVNTTGSVSGEIHHSILVVEAGAAIEGTVFRTDSAAHFAPAEATPAPSLMQRLPPLADAETIYEDVVRIA